MILRLLLYYLTDTLTGVYCELDPEGISASLVCTARASANRAGGVVDPLGQGAEGSYRDTAATSP